MWPGERRPGLGALDTAGFREHLPIGLADDVRIRRRVAPGQVLTFDDVQRPETEALGIWCAIRASTLAAGRVREPVEA
jgi:predicted homoserine dehydrogenase-like protein